MVEETRMQGVEDAAPVENNARRGVQVHPPSESEDPPGRCVLAFSGGGFRATLFHLGVVRYLADAGILQQVTDVTAVSGGSILGAHLLLRWNDYVAGGEQFDKAAHELLVFVRRDLRNRIVCSLFLSAFILSLFAFIVLGMFDVVRPSLALLLSLLGSLFLVVVTDCLVGIRTCLLIHFYRELYRKEATEKHESLLPKWVRRHAPIIIGSLVSAILWVFDLLRPEWFDKVRPLWVDWNVPWIGGAFNWWVFAVGLVVIALGCSARLVMKGMKWHNRVKYEPSLLGDLAYPKLPSANETSVPRLYLLATTLNHGLTCWFTQGGFYWYEMRKDKEEQQPAETSSPELALAVAASSAFPPMFPPVRLTRSQLSMSDQEFPRTLELTDAGVYDNAGLDVVSRQIITDGPLTRVIASDAEGQFDSEPSRWLYLFSLPRNWRTTCILMKRAGDLASRSQFDDKLVPVSIRTVVQKEECEDQLDPRVQRAAESIRTDLDNFTDEEIHVLISHGYAVARKACKDAGVEAKNGQQNGTPWSPIADAAIRSKAMKGTLDLPQRTVDRLAFSPRRQWRWICCLAALSTLVLLGLVWRPAWLYPAVQEPDDIVWSITPVLDANAEPIFERNTWLMPTVHYLLQEGGKPDKQSTSRVVKVKIHPKVKHEGKLARYQVRVVYKTDDLAASVFPFAVGKINSVPKVNQHLPLSGDKGVETFAVPEGTTDDGVIVLAHLMKQRGEFPNELSEVFRMELVK